MRIIVFFDLILEAVKYILAGYALFEQKIETRYVLGAIVTIGGIALTGNITDNVSTMSIVVLPFFCVALFITAELPVKDRIIYVCKLTFLISCIDYIIEIFIKFIDSISIKDESAWLISNLISLLVYSCIYIVQKNRKLRNDSKIRILRKVILYGGIIIMAITMPMTISGLNFFAEKSENLEQINSIRLLSAMSMIGMIMLVMFVIYINDTNKKIKQYLERERELKETQKKYYEAMLQKDEDTKKFRHDVSNHIMCIRELAEREELGEVKQYIDEMQGQIIKIQKRSYSIGNSVIDAVLNYYLPMLQEGVEIKVRGYLEEDLSISDVELCTIFSNIIQNSVEELKKQQNGRKYLEVKIHTGKQDFIIKVCNSAQGKKQRGKGNLTETSKSDKKNHGIGLKNVRETVEKNKGIFQWQSEEEEFKVKVILPLRLRG